MDNLEPETLIVSTRCTQKRTYVVAVRVLNQCQRVVSDLIDELNPLRLRGMVDATLQDAAAVTMSSNLYAVGCDRIVDELNRKSMSP